MGIDDTTPTLSWQLQSAQTGTAYRGMTQTAYEVQVGSQAGGSDLWDSGMVASSDSLHALYGGKALTNNEVCYWQVRVYDGNGLSSPWSASAQWSMGLIHQTNWLAQWIGYDAAYSPTSPQLAPIATFNTSGLSWVGLPSGTGTPGVNQVSLRKQIVLPTNQTITNAVFCVYADNYCIAYVNGTRTTNDAARWEATALMNVTPLLHAGTNVLGLSATNSDQVPATVIGQLVVQYASGAVTNIPVDGTWQAAQLPSPTWTQVSFNASSWPNASGGNGNAWGTPSLNDLPRMPAPYLRKDFSVGQTVMRATVFVTALGTYELHLNGQKVGKDVLAPGWTQFTKRVYYQTYDVTSLVQAGSNTIGAILGDGWYASDLAFKGTRCNYGGVPRFMAQLVLQLADGTQQTIVTDNSWKASYGPIQFGDLLMGSKYDARLEMPGWDMTNFVDSAWSPVATGTGAAGFGYTNVTSLVASFVHNNTLNFTVNNTTMGGDPDYGVAKVLALTYSLNGITQTVQYAENTAISLGGSGQTLVVLSAYYGGPNSIPGNGGFLITGAITEPSRCFENIPATNMTQPAAGCYTFDLGQNIAGWARITVSGNAGDIITVRHGEMLNPGGLIYTANLRGAEATDTYILSSNGVSTFEPRFTFHGFRYVEIRGLSTPPTVAAVTGVVVHSDMAPTGSFQSSSPLLNHLYSNIVWSHKGNYLEVPTDCPQRDERMGWTGDTEFFIPTAAYNFDIQSFFRRHMLTYDEDSIYANGSMPNVAPDLSVGTAGIAWSDASWICPDTIYRAYGDTNIIADNYAAMQSYGAYLSNYTSGYTLPSTPGDLGDWLNLGGAASEQVIDTAFYAGYAQAMSEMAGAIGRTNDAVMYATLHSNIANAFGSFFNSSGAFSDGSSQTGYALAYTFGLVPTNLASKISQQFANSIASYDYHLATGFIGTPRLLPALHLAGLDNLAYTVLLQQTYPSWLYQVTLGATTMWERWDGWTPAAGFETQTMNSFNHYSFGAVGQYLYDAVGGISSTSPGYKTIQIAPIPGNGLTWAATSYDSARGMISTAWTNFGGELNLAVTIPPNTTAQVLVPTINTNGVTESGMPAGSSPGVAYLGYSNGAAMYAVGSGNYFFVAPQQIQVSATETDAVYAGGSFPPLHPGDLITNSSTTVVSNQLALGPENEFPYTYLRDGKIGAPNTTNYSVEISGGYITYNLGAGPSNAGYTITNLTTYTAWRDNGREDANYSVLWSPDGSNYFTAATVSYNPSPYPTTNGTGGTVTSLAMANLTGVRYLTWNFSAGQQNGGVGYTELAAYGVPTVPLQPATISAAMSPSGGTFVMSASGLSTGQTYVLQATTNLANPSWVAQTNFVATQASMTITNSTSASSQMFYRLVGY